MSRSNLRYGHRIGSLYGKPIFDEINDQDNNARLVFVRIAIGDTDGFPLDQLKPNEVLFSPGIIYRKVSVGEISEKGNTVVVMRR